jgi:hypothetical protein
MKSLKAGVSNINGKQKWIVIGHIILFILFLSALPTDSTFGIERIVATFVLSFIISYGITLQFKKSIIVGILFTLLMGLLDSRGPFSDYRKSVYEYQQYPLIYKQFINKYTENFEIKPAGDLSEDKGNSYSTSKTEDVDTTNFKDEDLDKILDNDEKQSNDEHENLKKAGGGLEQLKDLLDMAKKESPYQNKDTSTYTPAQAQRATFHLIDTVKQLKETMSEMMPLMKAGNNLMELHKKMNGQLTQA